MTTTAVKHDGYRSRKLWITIGHSLLFTALLVAGILTEGGYLALESILVIFFTGGNVAEKFARGPA